jgi:two-component system OmpR family sensor kinase
VLDNLLANVAKYTPDDSPVTVRVTVDPDGAAVVTSVEDAGDGIPEGDRERVFEKFVRLGDHLTRAQQGVGLGLYIVRRTVEAMGGSVQCIPSPAGGAAFVVRLRSATVDLTEPAVAPATTP